MNHIRSKYSFLAVILALCSGLTLGSCQEEAYDLPDYTVAGQDVTVGINVKLPEMDKQSRANLTDYDLDYVQNLWIRTYSASTGRATSEWKVITPGTHTSEPDLSEDVDISIDTQSGYSYIVGVANVTNMAVSKDDPNTRRPLSELLTEADTWDKFLNIAVVSPSTFDRINAPLTPVPMAGCYVPDAPGSHTHASNIGEWQKLDFQQYFIPTKRGKVELPGAIHLRRLVSHITFNFVSGRDDMELTVNSYRVFNAPRFTWLYERSSDDGMLANFGDQAVDAEDADANYFVDVPQYASQYINSYKQEDGKEVSSFNFWLGENKQSGLESCQTYNDREKLASIGSPLFSSLTGDGWTPANMATYVVVSCALDYDNIINVDNDGTIVDNGGDEVYRNAYPDYIIHLGYIGQDSRDFNSYRNGEYTYNVTVNGVNDIVVDAHNENEYPGEEGVVNDLMNETIELDAHYHAFNIRLTQEELQNPEFGFIITTFRDGDQYTFDEKLDWNSGYLASGNNSSVADRELYNWIELRATTGEDELAEYKSRYTNYTGKTTFLLSALSEGWDGMTDQMRSDSEWYTVFVNEYAYEAIYGEANYGNESINPKWRSYVNQNPRRFYIKTTRAASEDGNSVYTRSKYGVTQQSMQTYYSDQIDTNDNTAIGMERENESEGLNMRVSVSYGNSSSNGRWNVAQWLSKSNNDSEMKLLSTTPTNDRPLWENFLDIQTPQHINAVIGDRAQGGPEIPDHTVTLPKLVNYGLAATATFSDPQGSNDAENFVEAINACMNRNRDNNGNGRIEPEELRWYVPAMDLYLRLVLGEASLPQPIMDYESVSRLPRGSRSGWVTTSSTNRIDNDYISRYMVYASNSADGTNNVLWAMEGMSTSLWNQAVGWSGNNSYPWQVRCVRNLGTNLTTMTSTGKVEVAYVFDEANRTVEMKYYDMASVRQSAYTGNGTAPGQMPVHLTTSDLNMPYQKFEYDTEDITATINNAEPQPETMQAYIYSNPCSARNAATGKTGWRIPNQMELAILRSEGILNTNNMWLSCTASYFNNFSGVGGTYTSGQNLFLGMLSTRGTLGSSQNLGDYTTVVRCVRDVTD